MDRVLIATSYEDLASYRAWAEDLGLGLELTAFSNPRILSESWRDLLGYHRDELASFSGLLGLHGAFFDMISASLDPAIVHMTRIRYRQNLRVALELGARYVVFHANYMGILKIPDYRPGWHQRQVAFWQPFAREAARLGIYVLLENLWEDDPTLIAEIVEEVNSPYLKVCLDIAHAVLFSDVPLATWIETVGPHVFSCHLNNHDGRLDLHWPLGRGVIDYRPVLARLRSLPSQPLFVLEMPTRPRIEASLEFFDLPRR